MTSAYSRFCEGVTEVRKGNSRASARVEMQGINALTAVGRQVVLRHLKMSACYKTRATGCRQYTKSASL